ncbi:MAG: hypothetical protein HYS59_00935 [Candidatus Vogelbacteria bacterium]|nr:hypothetical protein [Candidatus Vogelbacteria bacterium]
MLTVFSALNFVAAAIMGLFALVTYRGGPTENTRAYARYVGWTALWALSIGIFLYIDPHEEKNLLLAVKLIYWIGTTIATSWFYFTLVYPNNGNAYLRTRALFIALNSLLLYVYFGTDFMMNGVVVGEAVYNRFPIYGPLWQPLFNGIFAFFLFGGFVVLFKKWRAEPNPTERRRHALLLWSAVIAFTPGVLLAVIFVALARNFDYYWISPTLTLIWIAYVSYSIFRHRLFNVRVIAAELSVLLLGIILFLNIFIVEIIRSIGLVFDALTGGIPFELSIYSILVWVAALVVGAFGALILTSSMRASSRIYAASTIAVSLWGVGLGFYYFFSDPALVTLLNRINHSFGNLIAISFFYFAYVVARGRMPRRIAMLVIAIAEMGLIATYLFSDAVIGPAFVNGILDRGWELGGYAWIFYVHFIGLTILSFYLLLSHYRARRGAPEASHILLITITSAIGFSLGGLTGVVLPMFGHFTYLWTSPLTVLFWVATAAVSILRYGKLNLRLLASQIFVFILLALLFGNIFVAEISSSLSVSLAPLRQAGVLPILIWVAAAILASHTVVLFFAEKRRSTRVLAATFAVATAWAISVGGFYAAPTADAATFWIRYTNYFGGHGVVLLAALFTYLIGSETWPKKNILIALAALEPFIIYAYLGSTLITQNAIFVGTSVFDREWSLGPIGLLHHLQILVLVLLSVYFLAKKRGVHYPNDPPHMVESTFRVFALMGAPAILAFVVPRLVGIITPNWLGPFFALGWAIASTATIVRYRIGNLRLFFAEVGVLATLIILLANVFFAEESFALLAQIAVFLAFVAAGAAFVYNVLKGERQRNELDTLTAELAALNKNLEGIVYERTQELGRAAQHTSTVIENLQSGIIEYAGAGMVKRMNVAAELLLGVGRQTIVGKEHLSLAPQERLLLSQVENTALSTVSEMRIAKPIPRELEVASIPLGRGSMRVLRDVTREKIIARSKTEFISIAAHQLRTPLSIIKWTLDLLKLGDLGPMTKRQRTMIRRADVTNERLISLVNDLLRVSRIDSGNEEYEFTDIDTVSMTKDALHDFAPIASSKKVVLRFIPPDSEVPSITGDAAKLRYVLDNAVQNAILYNISGGSVTAMVAREGGGAVRIDIIDTGIGIPEQDQGRMFSKFFRTEQAVKIHTEGTGLSLFIMKHIMNRHGGDMTITSRPGAGTTVTLTLPPARTTAQLENSTPSS